MDEKKYRYFANLPDDEIGFALDEKRKEFERYVDQAGLFGLWKKAFQYYYSQDEKGFTGHHVGKFGEKKQFSMVKMNHFRSIVKRWRNLADSQHSAMQCVAKFNGYESEQQVKRGNAIIENAMIESRLAQCILESVEISSFLGAGHLVEQWNPEGGELYLPMSSQGLIRETAPEETIGAPPSEMPPEMGMEAEMPPMAEMPPEMQPEMGAPPEKKEARQGKLEASVYTPVDYIIDPRARHWKRPWCITRDFASKYDLAAQYAANDEKLAERICSLSRSTDILSLDCALVNENQPCDTDEIEYYTFLHEKTPACPRGKKVVYLRGDLVLKVSDLGSRRVFSSRIAPSNIVNSPWGYTDAWDLLAPQEAVDALFSITVSNMKTFGLGLMMAPKGSGITSSDVAKGLKLLEYNPGLNKPEPMQMPQTPNQVIDVRKDGIGEMGTIIGVNDTARGAPQASLESGSSLAIVHAQAVEATSDFQESINLFKEGVAMDCIELHQTNITDEMLVPIMGEKLAQTVGVSKEGLKEIIAVKVKPVNPMSKSVSGRFQMAESVASRFPDQVSPQQFMRLVQGGNDDVITDPMADEDRLIELENEMLARGVGPPPYEIDQLTGQPAVDPKTGRRIRGKGEPGKQYVRVVITDNPLRHAQRHLAVLSSQAARDNPAVTKAVLEHIDDHEDKYADLTVLRPGLTQMLNIPPLAAAVPPDPMAMMGGPQGKPPGAKPGEAGSGQAPQEKVKASDEAPPGTGGAPKMPAFPKNPTDGERYQPPQTQ